MTAKKIACEAGMKKDRAFDIRHLGKAHVILATYEHGGNLAVELEDENGEPMAVLSVNIPESSHLLREGEFFVKTWNENEEISQDALASGLFRNTGRTHDGFLRAPIWTLQ